MKTLVKIASGLLNNYGLSGLREITALVHIFMALHPKLWHCNFGLKSLKTR